MSLSSATRVAGFAYTWDNADRRASERHLAAVGVSARTETYTYDSALRITQVAFGDARPATSYLIDGVGNWASRTEGGQTQTTNQRQNGAYAPDLMNEVSRLATFNALGSLVKDEQQTQDANGNRIKSGEFKLSFDVFDRLVRVERTSDGATVGRYRYDALGRRVDRMFVARGDPTNTERQVFHVSDGAQEVEELDGSGALVADYVWGGLYLDQCVQVRRNGQEFYLHTNSIFSVVAATNASGQVVERYAYSSIYGVGSVKDAAGADRPASAEIGNPWRFQGRRFDSETGFYYFRLRYLDPAQGRFVNRDPIGVWGDAGNLGNGYSFCGNDPVNRVDPWGLDTALLAAPPVIEATVGVAVAPAVGLGVGLGLLVSAPWAIEAWLAWEGAEAAELAAEESLKRLLAFRAAQRAAEAIRIPVPVDLPIDAPDPRPEPKDKPEPKDRPEPKDEEDKETEFVTIYRGTSLVMENWIYAETGQLLSEAAIQGYDYYGAKSILSAYTFAGIIHLQWVGIWGSEYLYAQAHSEFGQDLPINFSLPRTFLSVTEDLGTAQHFAGPNGTVYMARVPRKMLEALALPGSPCEKEWLLRGGSGPIIFTPMR